MAASRLCSIPGCDKHGRVRRGYCNAHYKKFLRHGDPLAGRMAPVARGKRRWLDENAVCFSDRDQCLIFPFTIEPDGYGRLDLPEGRTGAHRYVCKAAHGQPPSPEHHAAHSCGNKPCVNRFHLRWATPKENAADRLLHGTDPRGEKNGNAKLTRPEVDAIIRLRGIETRQSLAKRFNVSPTRISAIQLLRQWIQDT